MPLTPEPLNVEFNGNAAASPTYGLAAEQQAKLDSIIATNAKQDTIRAEIAKGLKEVAELEAKNAEAIKELELSKRELNAALRKNGIKKICNDQGELVDIDSAEGIRLSYKYKKEMEAKNGLDTLVENSTSLSPASKVFYRQAKWCCW